MKKKIPDIMGAIPPMHGAAIKYGRRGGMEGRVEMVRNEAKAANTSQMQAADYEVPSMHGAAIKYGRRSGMEGRVEMVKNEAYGGVYFGRDYGN